MALAHNREASSKANIGNTHAKCKNGWENPRTSEEALKMWKHAKQIYELHLKFPNKGFRALYTMTAFNGCSESIRYVVARIQSGWNPNMDSEYTSWLKTQNIN